MPIAIRHSRDPVPSIARPAGWSVALVTDTRLLAALHQRDEQVLQERIDAGHRAYVASLDGTPAAFGWVATQSASIGELGFSFTIAPRERYLWNFVTLPDYRGRGVYPCLVNDIVRRESVRADRFWIAYAPENHASGRGIRRAGFVDLAALSFLENGQPALADLIPGGAARARTLLGISTTPQPLAPCWRCVRAGRAHSCAEGACACDYQQPVSGCAQDARV
jgi:GNAT superfamily N-acetyltransferase